MRIGGGVNGYVLLTCAECSGTGGECCDDGWVEDSVELDELSRADLIETLAAMLLRADSIAQTTRIGIPDVHRTHGIDRSLGSSPAPTSHGECLELLRLAALACMLTRGRDNWCARRSMEAGRWLNCAAQVVRELRSRDLGDDEECTAWVWADEEVHE